MKKLTGIIALGLALVLIISLSPVSAGPALFTGKDKNGVEFKPFIFMPVAKYMPHSSTGQRQVEGHHQYHMTNNTGKTQKFTAEVEYCGPVDRDYWAIVQFCFSDACYIDVGTTGAEIKAGVNETMTFQFGPPNKTKDAKFGTFATSKVTLYPKDDKSISDEIYMAAVHIPFTQITLPIDDTTMTLEKCPEWDPMNRNKAKRYPLVKSTKTLDQPATIVNNRTYIPLRALAEEMYSEVGWEASTRTASFTIGDSNSYFKMALQIDNPVATTTLKTCDGKVLTKKVTMPAPAIIQNGRTVVPVRSLGETLMGGEITWEEYQSRTVMLYLPGRLPEDH